MIYLLEQFVEPQMRGRAFTAYTRSYADASAWKGGFRSSVEYRTITPINSLAFLPAKSQ